MQKLKQVQHLTVCSFKHFLKSNIKIILIAEEYSRNKSNLLRVYRILTMFMTQAGHNNISNIPTKFFHSQFTSTYEIINKLITFTKVESIFYFIVKFWRFWYFRKFNHILLVVINRVYCILIVFKSFNNNFLIMRKLCFFYKF